MKSKFDLYAPKKGDKSKSGFVLNIIGQAPKNKPYVSIDLMSHDGVYVIADRDLERLAVNILKALKSKKLK